ncbi:MAG TPA: hypothetical protein VLB80_02005, partial [Candidatus Babeliales bacterium]|nr:hypothetical protein [Candidatus Babeliales bacterium]
MFFGYFYRFFSLFISFSLLIAPLPLHTIAQDILINLSLYEIDHIAKNTNASYIYLGKELSDIVDVITKVSNLDSDINSPLYEFKNHIKEGILIAEYDSVIEVLLYAKLILESNCKKLDFNSLQQIIIKVDEIINQVEQGLLTINSETLKLPDSVKDNYFCPTTRAHHLKKLKINKNINVLGASIFHKHINAKQGIYAKGKLKIGKSALFKKDITIEGSLSAKDATAKSLIVDNLIVENCMNHLCTKNLSVIDESVSGTLSVNDTIMQNASINTLLCEDASIQNLTLTGALSFTDLSVVDQIVSGTLSVNNEIIDGSLKISSLAPTGVVHNDALGNLSSSLVVNADIDPAAAIVDTKLATISTAGKVANSATTATNLNIPNTIVSRDVSGNFSVEEISIADAIIKDLLKFQDTSGTKYIGIQAPSSIISPSYTLTLPSIPPAGTQLLRANLTIPTDLEWAWQEGSVPPENSKTIYVTKYGNDLTGDGSFGTPYATLNQAITIANSFSSSLNPITIKISTGIYIENNSTGPLTITADGISIVGDSPSGVIVMPNTPENNLLLVNNPIEITTISFASFAPVATGIILASGNLTTLNNVRVLNFLIGVDCIGGVNNSYGFNTCLFINNGLALSISNANVEWNSCTVFGTTMMNDPVVNKGIFATGSDSHVVLNSGTCGLCDTAINITNNAIMSVNDISFRLNAFDIIQETSAHLVLSGCTFALTTGNLDVDIKVSGAGSIAEVVGCEFNGSSITGNTEGTAIIVTDNATVNISGGSMHNYTTGLHIGVPGNVSSTNLSASGLVIKNCVTDILQEGISTLNFNAGTATGNKISINDPTNVVVAYFDLSSNSSLSIGSISDKNTALIQAAITSNINPEISYQPSLYSTQAIGFNNPLHNPSTWFINSLDNADIAAITQDRTKTVSIKLLSDEGHPVGGISALRGWDLQKNGSTGELALKYQNSDIVGQSIVPQYTLIQFDGVNNEVQLPTVNTKLIFGSDTNLYRDGANILKTDDNFIVGALTPDRVVTTSAITNQFNSSIVTNTELNYLSGTTSPIQAQLNSKVAKAGDVMTGILQLPAGTSLIPSLTFTGSTTTGLSANSGDLSLSTNALERIKISSGGTISIDAFTVSGIVHNDAS